MSCIVKQRLCLPKRGLDLSKWAVIACDQFSSDKEYWEKVKNYVSGSPTTLDLILPEVYLSNDNSKSISEINKNMISYNANDLLCDEGYCMILVKRTTDNQKERLGLVLTVDLEEYSFKSDEKKLIRATEETIVERIPPRVEIRKDAIFELSHVILLFDDREQNIIENLYNKKDSFEKVYDFNLNFGGGHIEGYKIKDVENVISKFDGLLKEEYLSKTFNSTDPILFAVGDGNHSLATAKEHWEKLKVFLSDEDKIIHPARYAMVEVVNIHDKGIKFEPIHRVVYNANRRFLKGLKKLYKINKKKVDPNSFKTYKLFLSNGKDIDFDLPSNTPQAIKMVQDYIDKNLEDNLDLSVDYIHGIEDLKKIVGENKNSIGIEMPKIDKNQLFEFILKNGSLPRKSFSIGEAKEKRYYLEGHKIKLI